jgi:DNA-binding response OmpR family regulator
VAIVDNYSISTKALTKVLEYAGMEVTTAGNSAVLNSLIKQGLKPDLLLVDLYLPGEFGLSVMRRLRVDPRWSNVTIVALTAFSTRMDRRLALEAGFDGFISKPIDFSSFTRTVRGFLKKGRQESSAA